MGVREFSERIPSELSVSCRRCDKQRSGDESLDRTAGTGWHRRYFCHSRRTGGQKNDPPREVYPYAERMYRQLICLPDGGKLSALDMSLGAVADLADMSVAEKIAETIHYKWELDETGYY